MPELPLEPVPHWLWQELPLPPLYPLPQLFGLAVVFLLALWLLQYLVPQLRRLQLLVRCWQNIAQLLAAFKQDCLSLKEPSGSFFLLALATSFHW